MRYYLFKFTNKLNVVFKLTYTCTHSQTIGMPGCTDSLCEDCFKMHFEVVISEKGVKHFNCPICDLPDMTNRDGSQDRYQMLFVHLVNSIYPVYSSSLYYATQLIINPFFTCRSTSTYLINYMTWHSGN